MPWDHLACPSVLYFVPSRVGVRSQEPTNDADRVRHIGPTNPSAPPRLPVERAPSFEFDVVVRHGCSRGAVFGGLLCGGTFLAGTAAAGGEQHCNDKHGGDVSHDVVLHFAQGR